jgi:hypothetical protein
MEIEKAKAKARDGLGNIENWLPDFMKKKA